MLLSSTEFSPDTVPKTESPLTIAAFPVACPSAQRSFRIVPQGSFPKHGHSLSLVTQSALNLGRAQMEFRSCPVLSVSHKVSSGSPSLWGPFFIHKWRKGREGSVSSGHGEDQLQRSPDPWEQNEVHTEIESKMGRWGSVETEKLWLVPTTLCIPVTPCQHFQHPQFTMGSTQADQLLEHHQPTRPSHLST